MMIVRMTGQLSMIMVVMTGHDAIGHLVNDVLQLLLDGCLVGSEGVHPSTQSPDTPSSVEACHL